MGGDKRLTGEKKEQFFRDLVGMAYGSVNRIGEYFNPETDSLNFLQAAAFYCNLIIAFALQLTSKSEQSLFQFKAGEEGGVGA